MIVRVAPNIISIVNSVIASLRSPGVVLGLGSASSRRGAFTNVEKIVRVARTMSIATNSSISRCGHTLMRSPCSRSTRWIPSGGTRARRRCFSGAPFFGSGTLPVGAGACRGGGGGAAARAAGGGGGDRGGGGGRGEGRGPPFRGLAPGRASGRRPRRALGDASVGALGQLV